MIMNNVVLYDVKRKDFTLIELLAVNVRAVLLME